MIEKNFSPERKKIQDEILSVVRDVQMGRGDKMEQAMKLTALTKNELAAKSADNDLRFSVDQNVAMMKRAMDALTNANESITEEEIEEYKSTASLRNDAMFRALARLQDKKNEKQKPKTIEIPKQLDLFKANEAREIDAKKMQAYRDFAKENNVDDDSVRMAVDNPDNAETKRLMTDENFAKAVSMYKSAIKEGMGSEESTCPMCGGTGYDPMKGPNSKERCPMCNGTGLVSESIAEGDYVISLKGKEIFRGKSEKDARSAFHKLRKEHGNDVKVKVEESSEPQAITEEEFDVLAEKKDACYHKVKSRYKVWPSAYASGALVKCRKVGAANWGKSKKKK